MGTRRHRERLDDDTPQTTTPKPIKQHHLMT